MNLKRLPAFVAVSLAFVFGSCNKKTNPSKPGIKSAQVPFSSLKPAATFLIGETADWVLVTNDSIWAAGTKPFSVVRIDPATNKFIARIPISGEACSGLTAGFGSLWVPVCGEPSSLVQIDLFTNKITATLPIGPAAPEGGIAASADSIWMVTSKTGMLARIDPTSGKVRQQVSIPAGSDNPIYSDGTIWVTGVDANILTAIDSASGNVLASIPVGSKPRFLASGDGAIWTLNQGDGTLSRVNIGTRKLEATVALGTPGLGGDIAYGSNSLWTTVFDLPLTQIDPRSNAVLHQWVGSGGDSLRVGFDSIWLTDYHKGLLLRIPIPETEKH
jgi:virginiamycin B lyase